MAEILKSIDSNFDQFEAECQYLKDITTVATDELLCDKNAGA